MAKIKVGMYLDVNDINENYELVEWLERTARENKQRIMANNKLIDMEKLRKVFDISKDSLKEYDSQLYYAILAILDGEKKPDASGYFNA